ncbi:transposase [Halorubrum sp. F4]|uniref:transposase n=1 Tax=Halorubrum sp. F4 TaxID=2989715 RepID=UPI0034E0B5FE
MSIWYGFLQEFTEICDPGSYGAIDTTFFDRETASKHYQHHSDRHIRTLKTTVLVDLCAILDIHFSAHWPHDTQTGRRVVLRNTEKIENIASDRGYDDLSLRDALRSEGVWLLLRRRLFAVLHSRTQRTIGQRIYGQHWIAETTFSAIKRQVGPTVHPRAWYRDLRELMLIAAVYKLEQGLKQ